MRGGEGTASSAHLPAYDGPKARIAVAAFEDETARGDRQIGQGLATMLTTALVNTNRYIVLERDILGEVIREQDLATEGRVQEKTGAPTGGIEGAELLIIGAVTEFEPEKFGVLGGILGLGSFITSVILHEKYSELPVGAATFTESHVAIDVRLVDAATSRVLASVSVEGRGQDWGGGVIGGIGGGDTRLPFAFGGFAKTAAEKAVRTAINRAATAITLQVPRSYLRHDDREYSGGRIFGFSHLDPAGIKGDAFREAEVRVVAGRNEWREAASALELTGDAAAAPVDFRSRQVIIVAAGEQDSAGSVIFVEKAVAFPDRVEIIARLVASPRPDDVQGDSEQGPPDRELSRYPVALIQTARTDLPVRMSWY